jgi:SsrA-binding protein
MGTDSGTGHKYITLNRRARHDYFIDETFEAGIVLQGTEVKSLREGKVNLRESFARILNDEVFLIGCHISPYSHGHFTNHDPLRDRKLLLHKKEIQKLIGKTAERGYTLVPLSMYFKKGRAKVEIGLAKGKKLYDKREAIKKRDLERELDQKFKS